MYCADSRMHTYQQSCLYVKAGGTSGQAAADTNAKAAAHTLCSHEQLLAYALPPSLWHDSQVADVGHVLGALICHKGPLLNPFCWQVGPLHVDHDSAKQTYPVWRQLKPSLHNFISLLTSQPVGVGRIVPRSILYSTSTAA